MEPFVVGNEFSSFEELNNEIVEYEKQFFVNLYIYKKFTQHRICETKGTEQTISQGTKIF